MEKVKLYREGAWQGEVLLLPDGGRCEARACAPDPGDGLYRAFLCGDAGEILIGVMAPDDQQLTSRRQLYRRDVQALGERLWGEMRRAAALRRQERWKATGQPGQLLENPFFRQRLQGVRRAWWRREEDRMLLALPVCREEGFPLETLFCLAKMELVEGELCAVFTFREEEPCLPEKSEKD